MSTFESYVLKKLMVMEGSQTENIRNKQCVLKSMLNVTKRREEKKTALLFRQENSHGVSMLYKTPGL